MRTSSQLFNRITAPIHTRGETYYLLENLSILLSSGTDILSAMTIIREAVGSEWMKQKINDMTLNIESGQPLWRALLSADILPQRMITLIKIGEEAGRLPENLALLVTQAQKEQLFHSRLQSAMMYPVLVITITVTVGIGIAWFILPKLSLLFSQLQIKLPLSTQILLYIGNALSHHGILITCLLVSLIGGLLYIFFINSKTKVAGQWIVFHVPGIKRLAQEVEIARFGYLFGTLLTAGLPLVDALRSLTNATPFRRYQTLYQHLTAMVDAGETMSTAFSKEKNSAQLIPLPIQQMLTAAWNSGRMPDTALTIGKIYEEKIDVTTKNISTLLEPILLIIVWLGVVNVALAVILPIYQLIGSLNGSSGAPVQRKKAPPTTVQTETPAARKIATVTSGGALNIRKDPSMDGAVIGKMQPKTDYTVIDETDAWYKIVLPNDTTGWVSRTYVTIQFK